MKKSHYEVLEVKPEANPADIKRAYRRKARTSHPDIGGDEAVMAEINAAYKCLADPARRLLYDQTGVDDAKPFDEEVRSVLLAAFSDALNKESEQCLVHAKQFIKQERANLDRQLDMTKQAERRLKKKRKEITAQQTNVFHLIIDQQLAAITTAIGAIGHQASVLDGAMRELDNYSSSERAAQQTVMYSTLIYNASAST